MADQATNQAARIISATILDEGSSVRCGAKTRAGGKCRQLTKDPSGRCPIHGPGYRSRIAAGLKKDPKTSRLKDGHRAREPRVKRIARLRDLARDPAAEGLVWELALLRLELEDAFDEEGPQSRGDIVKIIEIIRRLVETAVKTRAMKRVAAGISETDVVAYAADTLAWVRREGGPELGDAFARWIRARTKTLVEPPIGDEASIPPCPVQAERSEDPGSGGIATRNRAVSPSDSTT